MLFSSRLLLMVLPGLLLPELLLAQATPEERVEWVYANELTYTHFERNPDTASTDYLINLCFSGPAGTFYHRTMSTASVHYDYQISPWTQRITPSDTILLETDQGLAFADREGTILRQTNYQIIEAIQGAAGFFSGSFREKEQVDIFRLTDRRPLIRLALAEGESLTFEGGLFRRSGYQQPTRFYNQTGELVLEENEHTITALDTNEPRFYVKDDRRYQSWLADLEGNVLAELPKGVFKTEGQGDRIRVQIGAFKKFWVDLNGQRITGLIAEPLLPGELDILYNCGVEGKQGASFRKSGITLPCEYDSFGFAWGDSSIVQAKKYTTRTYFKRNGELCFDPGPQTVSRYLGGGLFVVGQREGCAFVRADGDVIVQTEVPVKDPVSVANADYLPDSQGGVLIISPKYARKLMAYDTSGHLLFSYESKNRRAVSWSKIGDNIRITEGTESFIVDRQGQPVESVRYRNPEYIYRDGQLKFIITNEIIRDRADLSRGMTGLLDGVATYLIDAETEEIILSSNTGMRWIDEEHLLLYYGTTSGVVRVR